MKTKFLLAVLIIAAGMVATPRCTFAAELEGDPGKSLSAPLVKSAGGRVEFREWHQGEPPLKLIRQEEGFCALTGVGGGFAGSREQARVYVGDDGYWYLGGKSMQEGLSAECVIVRYPATQPVAAKRVVILAASYSFGSEYADVTARVKTLLRTGKTFQANPAALLTDPHPGWNKALVIFCKVDGKRAIFSVGEGEPVSRELLAEKAHPVVKENR